MAFVANGLSEEAASNGLTNFHVGVRVEDDIIWATNVWLGPSASIDMNLLAATYVTTGAVTVTGFTNAIGDGIKRANLFLLNSSRASVTLTLPSTGIVAPKVASGGIVTIGPSAYSITNGILFVVSVTCEPGESTNVTVRPMW